MSSQTLLDGALAALGKRRLLFAIHDVSFPSKPDEDTGVGSPGSRAAGELLRFVRAQGFNGIQLGPQGETPADYPSPYDGTVFSRSRRGMALAAFQAGGPYEDLVSRETLEAALVHRVPRGGWQASHPDAERAMSQIIGEAWANARSDPQHAALLERADAFAKRHAFWLPRDALYDALQRARRDDTESEGPADTLSREAGLYLSDDPKTVARRADLGRRHDAAIRAYGFAQLLAHEEHARVRQAASALGLAWYADLQIGYARGDAWCYASAFLPGYRLGAPPSRTNPEGQPWHYPLLDPARYGNASAPGPAMELFTRRLAKVFDEHDGVRVDHPHGLVCPWVYRADRADTAEAVRAGARLFGSPDLDDHPLLASYAIATPQQLDTSLPRHADQRVRELSSSQIERYAIVFDAIMTAASHAGRGRADVSSEVLSTQPYPLRCVLERHGLGRWRILQKANLGDPNDVYRSEQAKPADWVMLGNHDTPSIWAWAAAATDDARLSWASHLAARLKLPPAASRAMGESRALLVNGMLAELFASRASHVMVFFTDLFGLEERFNRPGSVSAENWTLRLPATFEASFAERAASGRVLDLPFALCLALRARGLDPSLRRALWSAAGPLRTLLPLTAP